MGENRATKRGRGGRSAGQGEDGSILRNGIACQTVARSIERDMRGIGENWKTMRFCWKVPNYNATVSQTQTRSKQRALYSRLVTKREEHMGAWCS